MKRLLLFLVLIGTTACGDTVTMTCPSPVRSASPVLVKPDQSTVAILD